MTDVPEPGHPTGEVEKRTTLRVLDYESAPAADVALSVRDGRGWAALGRTNEVGELVVIREYIAGTGIIADAPSSALVVMEMPDEPGDVQEIRLPAPGSIRGKVVLSNGRRAGTGVKVYARRNGYEAAGAASVRRASLCDRFATTDESGEFIFRRLVPNRLYSLSAGGMGVVSMKEIINIQPDTEPVEIRAQFVAGAVLEFRTQDGALATVLPVHRFFGHRRSVHWPDGKVLSAAYKEAALAGVCSALAEGSNPHLILFTTDRPPTESYSVVAHFEKRFLGYEPCSIDVQLGWLGEPIPVYEVPIQQEPVELGELVVLLTPPVSPGQWGLRPSRPHVAPAQLQMIRPGHSKEEGTFLVDLYGIFDGPCHLEGIPHGTYSAQVIFNAGSYTFPPVESGHDYVTVTIGDRPATLRVPVGGLATLRVNLVETNGKPYRGSAMFELGRGVPVLTGSGSLGIMGGGGMIVFEQPPYVFPALLPDIYHVMPDRPMLPLGEWDDGLPPSIRVEAGQDAVITVTVGGEL